jgi:hypothetical protein
VWRRSRKTGDKIPRNFPWSEKGSRLPPYPIHPSPAKKGERNIADSHALDPLLIAHPSWSSRTPYHHGEPTATPPSLPDGRCSAAVAVAEGREDAAHPVLYCTSSPCRNPALSSVQSTLGDNEGDLIFLTSSTQHCTGQYPYCKPVLILAFVSPPLSWIQDDIASRKRGFFTALGPKERITCRRP